MNALMNMDPWGILDELLGVPNRTVREMKARASGRFPPANVYLDDNALMIEIELPGKTAKDVDLTLEPQAVVIADRPAAAANGDAATPKPAWCRRIELPFRVNADKAGAKFENGILRIDLPKAETLGAKRIPIAG